MVLRRTRLRPRAVAQSDHSDWTAPAHDSRSKRRRLDVSSSKAASSKSFSADSRSLSLSSDPSCSYCRTKRLDEASRCPGYGVMSICGRRREMEDTVSIHPAFAVAQHHRCPDQQQSERYHFFGIFDGHGCSHVSTHLHMHCMPILIDLLHICSFHSFIKFQ